MIRPPPLYEDVIVGNGQVMNPSYLDYGFSTFLEMPEIEAIEVETDDPIGPFGAKEAGEGTQLPPFRCRQYARRRLLGLRYPKQTGLYCGVILY